ncbi:gustatory receptor for sugar taste 64a-like isoform X2 [Maniola jurtina]|uniref:gustatory receptor for sugar taste 64a-like isoform X2 n=1 Tax=Maniola jurtina TaxID=191418 RepID=UPI001E68702E|nr:gustatory receptor for sugar taste 64a-like isoform X2 [Maniola jurtina]
MKNKKTSNNTRHRRDMFLRTVLAVFTAARWFGIPTYGGSMALYWAIVLLIMLIGIEVAAIWKLIRALTGVANYAYGTSALIGRLSGSIFYGNAVLSLILCWRAVNTWKKLSVNWLRVETKGLLLSPDARIKRRITFVVSFIILCAIVEHTLSMISATGLDCPPEEYFERYILSSHGFLLHTWEYTLWLAIPIFILSKSATILWNFQDLIIIVISMGLTSRYRRLNSFVEHVVRYEKRDENTNKLGTEFYYQLNVWRSIREAFAQQSALVRQVDEELGVLFLLSNLNNLYFICLQLYQGIRKVDGVLINRIYYFYSLGWLLLRACTVVLAAADVNLYSKRALPFLFSCPSSAYNIEIHRLKNQLTHDNIALSAMGFFYLDRQKLLQVAAAIVKYELILIQYDK